MDINQSPVSRGTSIPGGDLLKGSAFGNLAVSVTKPLKTEITSRLTKQVQLACVAAVAALGSLSPKNAHSSDFKLLSLEVGVGGHSAQMLSLPQDFFSPQTNQIGFQASGDTSNTIGVLIWDGAGTNDQWANVSFQLHSLERGAPKVDFVARSYNSQGTNIHPNNLADGRLLIVCCWPNSAAYSNSPRRGTLNFTNVLNSSNTAPESTTSVPYSNNMFFRAVTNYRVSTTIPCAIKDGVVSVAIKAIDPLEIIRMPLSTNAPSIRQEESQIDVRTAGSSVPTNTALNITGSNAAFTVVTFPERMSISANTTSAPQTTTVLISPELAASQAVLGVETATNLGTTTIWNFQAWTNSGTNSVTISTNESRKFGRLRMRAP